MEYQSCTLVQAAEFPQFGEQGLNLNRSWYIDHSHVYISSRIQRICLFEYFKCSKARQPSLSGGRRTGQRMIVEINSSVMRKTGEKRRIVIFSRDSDLEAFSRNPTHGSFSALTFQSTDLPIM